ncbi:MAG: indole-3-glycerol phosphate synthase TrpC, partial [Acidobacteriota bacterium]
MESDILSRIIAKKEQEVEEARRVVPDGRLMVEARRQRERRSFLEKLSTPGRFGANIIAEIKRGSPSRGLMGPDLDARLQAELYERGGAAAISVLTDRTFFHGSPEDLRAAREAVDLPVLRKDFIISPYQIYEAVCMGADAVLLIARVLRTDFLRSCVGLCRDLQIDALVEVHTAVELEEATLAGARIIGINNRDLSTFKTDIQTSIDLVKRIEPGQVVVAESGIHGREQIERLLDAGIHNFLIGESLVKSDDTVAF